MKNEDRVWKTKDGRKLRLGDMDTDHLKNAARYARKAWRKLERQALSAIAYAGSAPDGAADAAEAEADGLGEQAIRHRLWEGAFLKELKRRGVELR